MRRGDGEYITYKSRRQRGEENIFHSKEEEEEGQPEVEEEEDMGDKNETPEDSAMHILNDLARGKATTGTTHDTINCQHSSKSKPWG
jgi:hypothetical protein